MSSDLASPSPRLHSCYSCHHTRKTCAGVLPPGYAHYSRLCPLLPLLTVIVRAAKTLPKRVNRDAPGPCKSLVLSACAYLRSSGRVARIYSCSDALACDLRLVCLRISTLINWKRAGIKSGGLHALSGRPCAPTYPRKSGDIHSYPSRYPYRLRYPPIHPALLVRRPHFF